MFLHVSVILYTGGLRRTPPAGRTPPGRENPSPPNQGEPPHPPIPGTRQTPPRDQADPPGRENPPRRRLQHTVNERPVRILLECILVLLHIIPLTVLFYCALGPGCLVLLFTKSRLSCFYPVGEGDVEDQEYQQLLTEHQLLLLEEEELLAIGRLPNAGTIPSKVHSH